MSGKTSKLIRKAAKFLQQTGKVKNLKQSIKSVKKSYKTRNSISRAKFKVGLENIPNFIALQNLNKDQE